MGGTTPLHVLPLVAAMGALTYVALQEAIRSRHAGADRMHRWGSRLSVAALVILATRLVQRATTEPAVAEWAIRVQLAAALLLLPFALRMLRDVWRVAAPRWVEPLVGGGVALTSVATLTTTWFFGRGAHRVEHAFGVTYFELPPGPLLTALALPALAVPAVIAWVLRGAPPEAAREKRAWVVVSLVGSLACLNDVLTAAGLLRSVHVFEWAMLALALESARRLTQRTGELQLGLERAVAERTGELEAQRLELLRILEAQRAGEAQFRELRAHAMRADRLTALGTLAAGAAHEINNPLSLVMSNLEAARDELELVQTAAGAPPLAEVLRMLRDAEDGAARIARTVRDLGALVRDPGRTPVVGAFDPVRALDAALQITWNQTRHRARVVRDVETVPRVVADESKLAQVFIHLLKNAAEAIPEGHAEQNEIRVAAREVAGQVVVEVSDTGVGIPAELGARIFDPFFTTKPVGSGSGLGLSVGHGIVTAAGGTITVRAREGGGTTVRVELPAAPGAGRAATTPAGGVARLRGRVLVVDDDALVARATARVLRHHDVDTVSSGREALARLEAQDYDAIVCDLMMPDLTGMDLWDTLVARDPKLAARIVFVTGGAFTDRAARFLEQPGIVCVAKPLDARRLVETVTALVVAARADDRAARRGASGA